MWQQTWDTATSITMNSGRSFVRAVKEANPDALILAEHYGDPAEWLDGEEWDSVMNYDAFMEPVTWFLTGMEKHSDEERADLRGNGYAFSRFSERTTWQVI